MKSNTAQRLRYLMDVNGYKQVDILNKYLPYAEEYGIKLRKNDIHYYVTGESEPGREKLTVLAHGLNVSEAWLMGFDVPMERNVPDRISAITTQKVPVIGNIACGNPIEAVEEFEAYVEVGADIKCDYCVRAKGDSMINARINDGDVVFIRQQDIVENGEIAAVLIDNEVTLKRFYYYPDDNRVVLQAENPRFEPLVYVGEELNHVKVLGKAVAFQSDLE